MDPAREEDNPEWRLLSSNRDRLGISSELSVAYLFREIDILLNAGVSLEASLKALQEIEINPSVALFLADAHQAAEEGQDIVEAVKTHRSIFGSLICGMIESTLRTDSPYDLSEIIHMISESPRCIDLRNRDPINRVPKAQKDFFYYLQAIYSCEIPNQDVFSDLATKCEEPYATIAKDLAGSIYTNSLLEVLQKHSDTFDAVTFLLLRCGEETIKSELDSIEERHPGGQQFLIQQILERP